MQPDRNQPDDWQQPSEQPSKTPYEAPQNDAGPGSTPVVTLAPDESSHPMVMSSSDEPADQDQPVAQPRNPKDEPIHWQAHEYIHHEKNALWFVAFAAVMLIFMAISIFVIKSITFSILIPVMAVALVVYSQRAPRLLDYTLSQQGLHINDRLYPFSDFKGFGVIHDGKEYSVMLLPIKRFKPGVSVYFPEEAGEAIVDILGTRLPMQEFHLDIVDQVIRKLRI